MINIIPSLSNYNISDSFFQISGLLHVPIFLKMEGWNMSGSIKLKPAVKIINELEKQGKINPSSKIIESSSGNFGIALSVIAAERKYKFTCVTDPNNSKDSIAFMRALGTEIIIVSDRDENGGFLGTRIKKIKELCKQDSNLIWVNQYANPNNFWSHYETTAPEILSKFKKVDYLFIGAGTTGTLMGCTLYFRKYSPNTKIIAIDTDGSVTFKHPSKKRYIPGIGTSRRPEILDDSIINDHILIPESETIRMCHTMARQGFLCGGSTGTVLAGISRYSTNITTNQIVVTIAPDLGHKYLNTIYNNDWLARHFPDYQNFNEVRYE